jgi:hypothetical protein
MEVTCEPLFSPTDPAIKTYYFAASPKPISYFGLKQPYYPIFFLHRYSEMKNGFQLLKSRLGMGSKPQLISIEQGNGASCGYPIHHDARVVRFGFKLNGKVGTECTQRLAMHDMAYAFSIIGI